MHGLGGTAPWVECAVGVCAPLTQVQFKRPGSDLERGLRGIQRTEAPGRTVRRIWRCGQITVRGISNSFSVYRVIGVWQQDIAKDHSERTV